MDEGYPFTVMVLMDRQNPAILAERSLRWDPRCHATHPFKRRHAPSSHCRWLPLRVGLGIALSILDGQALPVFAWAFAADHSRIRPRGFHSVAHPPWNCDGPPIPKRKRLSGSQEVPSPRPGSAAKPTQEKYPSHGIPVAIVLRVRGAIPFFACLHGPDFRIRLVAGSCSHRVSQPLQGSYWSSLPGFHLPRCQAGSSAFSPSLFRWIPFPRWGVGMLPLLRRFSGRLTLSLVFRLSADFQG